MRVLALRIRNYRTLENLDLEFPEYYTAICGKNDSGKTNIVRVLRSIMKEESPYFYRQDQEISIKNDYTKWKVSDPRNGKIQICMIIEVNPTTDAGLVPFLERRLRLDPSQEPITLQLDVTYTGEEPKTAVSMTVKGTKYAGLDAEEVLEKLQSSNTILFYNSTELDPRMNMHGGMTGYFRDLVAQYSTKISDIKESVNKKLRKITKGHQRQLESLLDRLETKYKISLSLPPFDFSYLPYNISLGQGKLDVSLDDWGSGTRNRTLILLTLFRAREIVLSANSAAKITPCIVVEEPESFLHPSAQAAFGRVLQELAREFQVQVISTTHSPYMLSLAKPECNVLLERKPHYGHARETVRVDTRGDKWMHPFGQALGIADAEFSAWKDVFFSSSDSILLVEGETDKGYFEMLRGPEHGTKALRLKGEIFAYGGKESLKQTGMVRFVKSKYQSLFITFDLDAEAEVSKCLTSLGLQKGTDFLPIGEDCAGKRQIEGLLPAKVVSKVSADHPELVQALQGTPDERKSAKSELKKLYFQEFKSTAKPGEEYFGRFYAVIKTMNKALS